MIAKQIAGLVERRIRQIQGLPEHPRRAALANLRRGIGRAPGELPELWGSFLQEMPPEFFSRSKARRSPGAQTTPELAKRCGSWQTNKGKTRRTAAPLSASAPCLRPTASKKLPITCGGWSSSFEERACL